MPGQKPDPKRDSKDGEAQSNAARPKNPLELIPKLIASAYGRAFTWAYARQVGAKVRFIPREELESALASEGQGLALAMRTSERLLLQWLFPAESWKALLGLWSKVHPGQDAAAPRNLMQLLSTPPELMAYLTHENLGADLESGWERRNFVPLSSNWDTKSLEGIRWSLQDAQLFEIGVGNYRFFLVWDENNLRRFTRRLVTDTVFRSVVNEQVLGRFSGREGAERAWYRFPGTKIALSGDFPLGTLLLPVLKKEGRGALVPTFLSAEIGPLRSTAGAAVLQRKLAIESQSAQILYMDDAAPQAGAPVQTTAAGGGLPAGENLAPADQPSLLDAVQTSLTGSTPFATLFGTAAIQETINRAQLQSAQGPEMLQITARYMAGREQVGKTIRVAVSTSFLNILSVHGLFPWDWHTLMDGPDSLLLLMLSVNEKLRRHPPQELMAFAGGSWAQLYYRQAAAQSDTILVAELLAIAPREDKIRLIQNCIIPEQKSQSTVALFYYGVQDMEHENHVFRVPTFQEREYVELLPKQPREEWKLAFASDKWKLAYASETYEDLISENTRVMSAIFRAFSRGDLELSWKPAHVLDEVFARRWHDEQHARAMESLGRGFSADIQALSKTPRRGSAILAAGPRLVALALSLDPEAAKLVKRPLVSSAFEKEFAELLAIHRPKLDELKTDFSETIAAIEDLHRRFQAELTPEKQDKASKR